MPGVPVVLTATVIRVSQNSVCSSACSGQVLQSVNLTSVFGGSPIRNLWSVAFWNSRATLVGCAQSLHSAFATRILEVDPVTGLTAELASVNGTSIREVAAIGSSNNLFFFLVSTRKGNQLIRLALNTLTHENWLHQTFNQLVHLSWDDRHQRLLGIVTERGACILVSIDWATHRIELLVDLADHVPRLYWPALQGPFLAASRQTILVTDNDILVVSRAQSSSQTLVFSVQTLHSSVLQISDVVGLAVLEHPRLNVTRVLPSLLGVAGLSNVVHMLKSPIATKFDKVID